MMDFLISLLKPNVCNRKYFVIEKFHSPCSCIRKCKYPPPGPKVKVPVRTDYYQPKYGPSVQDYPRDS